MNQIKIGNYIQIKRKEKNLTQEQLAEKLHVSNKTISKWECGKALPDYSLVEPLCEILEITTQELFSGEDNTIENDKQMLEMLKRFQDLEKQKKTILGILLIILGITCFIISQLFTGSNFEDFFSGVLIGISIGGMLIGVYITASSLLKK